MENQNQSLSNLQKVTINSLTEIVKLSRELPTVRNSDPNEVNKAILGLVIEVFAFYNESPNNIQLPLILQQTKENVLGLTLADIDIFKKHCLNGNYTLKFRLTPNIFIDWLKEYQFERMEAFENLNFKAKIEIEKQPVSVKTTEMLKEISDKVKPQPIFSTDKPTESERDKFIKQQWAYFKFKFNEVWKGQGMTETTELNPREYVTFGSKMYFQNDYIKLMVEKDLANYDKK
jgi:hypothetical protein